MKHFILAFCLLTIGSLQAETYYVRPTGDATSWNNLPAAAGLIITSSSPTIDGAFIYYFAKGTYSKAGIAMTTGNIYGGFSGNETTIDLAARALSDKDNNGLVEPWEFSNETIINGTVPFITASPSGARLITVTGGEINGLTIQDHFYNSSGVITLGSVLSNPLATDDVVGNAGKMTYCTVRKLKTNVTGSASAGGGPIMTTNQYSIIDGCLIEECLATGAFSSGAVTMNNHGGKLINSVLRNNAATYASTDIAGAIRSYTPAANNMNAIVQNCAIYNNTSGGSPGAIRSTFVAASTGMRGIQIINCTVVNNKTATTSNSGSVELIYSGLLVNSIIVDDLNSEFRAQSTNNYITSIAYGAAVSVSAAAYPGTNMVPGKTAADFNFKSVSSYVGAMQTGAGDFNQTTYDAIRASNFSITSNSSVACTATSLASIPANYKIGGTGTTVNLTASVPANDINSYPRASNATLGAYALDNTAPTVAITSSAISPTSTTPIPVTITFNENVTGFVVGDLTVGNGSASNFTAVSAKVFTANITPTAAGAVTVDIAANAAKDGAGNNSTVATQFSITFQTAPAITNTAVTSITSTSATFNANISDNGEAAITERGFCYKSTNSVTIADNKTIEGGTAAGDFSKLFSLTPNTHYYYKGYAINSVGTTLSSTAVNFYTLPAAPTSTAGGTITASGFTAKWTAPTQGPAGFTYTVEYGTVADLSSGTTLVASIASTNLSSAIGSLSANTTYYYRVKAVNSNGSGAWSDIQSVTTLDVVTVSSDKSSSTLSTTSTTDVTVSAGELTIDADANVKSITVAPGAKLTYSAGTLTATNGITLQNTASGTASFIDGRADISTAIAGTVEQAIAETNRNWYVAVPVSGQTNANITLSGASIVKRNEGAVSWETVTGSLTAGVGYIAVASASAGAATWSLAGNLNSGQVLVGVTRAGATSAGFNLLGNPYPSYLNWEQVLNLNTTNASLLQPSIWYRTATYNAGLNKFDYTFNTYNSIGRVATPTGTTGYIPPVQAFWVRANSAGNVTFTNEMRSHGDGANKLKAPAANTVVQPLVRLQIANATSKDEAVLYFNPNASNAVDNYDTPKMFENASATKPEIFTQVNAEKLVINGLNAVQYNTEIPVGIVAKQSGDYTISANEMSNFEVGTRVILIDKMNPTVDIEFGEGIVYNFSSQITEPTTDRFSLIFRAPGITTGFENIEKLNAQVFVNAANQITIIAPEKASFSIYNGMGQKVTEGITKANRTVAKGINFSGVYVVLISENGRNSISRVILNNK